MTHSYRFYGPEIGEATAIVDADVVGVNENGIIEFEPHDDALDPIGITSDRLSELADQNKAYDLEQVDKSDPIWGAIADVESRYKNAPDDKQAFIDAAKTLFIGAA